MGGEYGTAAVSIQSHVPKGWQNSSVHILASKLGWLIFELWFHLHHGECIKSEVHSILVYKRFSASFEWVEINAVGSWLRAFSCLFLKIFHYLLDTDTLHRLLNLRLVCSSCNKFPLNWFSLAVTSSWKFFATCSSNNVNFNQFYPLSQIMNTFLPFSSLPERNWTKLLDLA